METVTKTITTDEFEITYSVTCNKINFDSVFVPVQHRGKGIARKAIIDIAEKEKCFYLTGFASSDKSRKIWKKCGFSFKRGSYFATLRIFERGGIHIHAGNDKEFEPPVFPVHIPKGEYKVMLDPASLPFSTPGVSSYFGF